MLPRVSDRIDVDNLGFFCIIDLAQADSLACQSIPIVEWWLVADFSQFNTNSG